MSYGQPDLSRRSDSLPAPQEPAQLTMQLVDGQADTVAMTREHPFEPMVEQNPDGPV